MKLQEVLAKRPSDEELVMAEGDSDSSPMPTKNQKGKCAGIEPEKTGNGDIDDLPKESYQEMHRN